MGGFCVYFPAMSVQLKSLSKAASKYSVLFLLVLGFVFFSRVYRLGEPQTYYFDEVYHAFTAQAYAKNDPKGYEWWHTAQEGFAYEWLHPPLAKLIQAASIKTFADQPFFWRFPGVLFGVATSILLYLFGKDIFHSRRLGFFASFLWSVDGLSFTMSRITMNDIYLVFWVLLAVYLFFAKKHKLLVGLVLGLAVSTKWSGVFAIGLIGLFWFLREGKTLNLKKVVVAVFSFLVVPTLVYVFSYIQFFLQGHTLDQFRALHTQTWWYQTTLLATHPYASEALSWPFLLRPLWAFVEDSGNLVAKIYLMGNPLIFFGGALSILYLVISVFKKQVDKNVIFVFVGYLAMFLPWVVSPRVMFIYHYLPAIPFLVLLLAWVLDKLWKDKRSLVIGYFTLVVLTFIFFYPHWTGIFVPKWLDNLYYWLPSWR